MKNASDWAARLASAVASEFAKRLGTLPRDAIEMTPRLHSIQAVSPEEVAVIFSDSVDGEQNLKGIRLNLRAVRLGPDRIRVSSIDELAFDLVYLGICEPRSIDEFLPADLQGIRWLPVDRWLE